MDVSICDVGPRDGLQNAECVLSPSTRAKLVNRLAAAGLPRVEAVSFVRDDLVPQMAHAETVVAEIDRRIGTEYAGLVLNERGHARLRATRLDRVNWTLAASDVFNRRNGNVSLAQAIAKARATLIAADRPMTVTVAVAFGCPFEGSLDPARVAALCDEIGGEEIVLADSIGVATPKQVKTLVERVVASDRHKRVGVHFHNTRNTGYANAVAALEAGAKLFDASIGGLGGCPFAPRATGNIATEDLVYLFEREGVGTGIDLDALISVSHWLEGLFGRALEGNLYRAGVAPLSLKVGDPSARPTVAACVPGGCKYSLT